MWLNVQLLSSQEVTVRDTVMPYEVFYNSAVKLIDSAKYKESLPLLKKAIKEKADYWEAYNKMAFAKMQMGNYKDAIKDLDKSEQILPLNYETTKMRGINYYLNNNFPRAKGVLDTAVQMAEEDKLDDAELYYYRALLMFKGKSYKEALENCEIVVDFKPNYVEAYILKGEIRFTKKEYNYAIREFSDAIKLMVAPNIDMKAYKLRAKSYFETGDFKAAVNDWNVYIEQFPKEEEALISRAAAKINMDDNTGAIVDLDAAIKINGKNPVSYCYRGVAKGGNKQYVEALKDLDYSIKMKFDYAAAYVNRAAIKMASKDKRGACKDLERADVLGDEIAYKLIEKYCKGSRN